jgi:hypothetical protein
MADVCRRLCRAFWAGVSDASTACDPELADKIDFQDSWIGRFWKDGVLVSYLETLLLLAGNGVPMIDALRLAGCLTGAVDAGQVGFGAR